MNSHSKTIVSSVGTPLPASILSLAESLPTKPSSPGNEGKYIRLSPLNLSQDLPTLYKFSNGSPITLEDRSIPAYDPEIMIWRYMSAGPFSNAEEMASFLQSQIHASNGLCLCVIDRRTNKQIGIANYMNNYPAHLKIELGNIWYSPIAQKTKANLETTYLMLKHAFGLGYRRIEWKCDSLNERSRRAALRMGFKFEGIQENHFIIKGRNRDTAWFRMLSSEWETVKVHLEKLLNC